MAYLLVPGHVAKKGQIRHIAMSVPDPWKTASFYTQLFGFEVVVDTDSKLAHCLFLSDGMFNIALLHFKDDRSAQGTGKDFVGFHHFGIWVDDVEGTRKLIEKAGGEWIMGEPDYKHNSAYEVKFHDINGVILDLVHNGWAGTQRRPGQADNQTMGKRTMVDRYAERRAKADEGMAKALGRDRVPA